MEKQFFFKVSLAYLISCLGVLEFLKQYKFKEIIVNAVFSLIYFM